MKLRTILTSTLVTVALFAIAAPAWSKPSRVIFVKAVSKQCKHLGSVSHVFEADQLYNQREGFKVTAAGPVFADALKAKAAKKGGNRLVLVEAFNDKTIYSGQGYHESIKRTQLRARVFKC